MSKQELKIRVIRKMCYMLWLRSDQSFNRLVAAQTLERKLIENVKNG